MPLIYVDTVAKAKRRKTIGRTGVITNQLKGDVQQQNSGMGNTTEAFRFLE